MVPNPINLFLSCKTLFKRHVFFSEHIKKFAHILTRSHMANLDIALSRWEATSWLKSAFISIL